MADLKKRAEAIVARAKYHVAKHKQADMDDVVLPGLKRYPEFKPLVMQLAREVAIRINAEAPKIESQMPYKAQFVLEELIRELEARV